MDQKFIILGVIIVAALILGGYFVLPGAIASQATILSISPGVTSPVSGQNSILVNMNVGNGYQAGYQASGSVQSSAGISQATNAAWPSNNSVLFTFTAGNNTIIYTITQNTQATGTIYSYALSQECQGDLGTLGAYNDCQNPSAPWTSTAYNTPGAAIQYPATKFTNWCNSLGGGKGIAYQTGTPYINDDMLCYVPAPAWQVGNLNWVGTYSQPSVTLMAYVYPPGVNPLAAQGTPALYSGFLTLTTTNTAGTLKNSQTGQAFADVQLNGMQPLFTSPPPATNVYALSAVTVPEKWQIVGDVETAVNAQLTNGGMTAVLQNSIKNANPSNNNVYVKSALEAAYNTYNLQVQNLPSTATLQGQWANLSNMGDINTANINTQNTISIPNTFSVPTVSGYFYTSAFQPINIMSTPTSVSCASEQLSSGQSYLEPITTTFTQTPSGQAAVLTLSCTGTVSQGGSATIYPTTNPATGSININTGQGGVSTCTATASGNGVTQTGTCTITVNAACTNPIPAGCFLQPTPGNPCAQNCTVTPTSCSDGTPLGSCNFANTMQCQNLSGALTLVPYACLNGGTSGNGSGGNATACYPYLQTSVTGIIGGINIPFLGNIGGSPAQSCVWNFTGIGLLLLVAAAIVYKVGKKEEIAKVLGIAGLVLIGLTFVVSNATALALGGVGLALIAVIVVAVWLIIKYTVI